MQTILTQSLTASVIAFILASIVVVAAGSRLTRVADRLADRTGLGEAIFGAVFLGASTSLPGIVTSVVAALDGHASLAVSNAVGGIAAQLLFLAVADVAYVKANLEHAAASAANILQGTLLITLLAIVMLAGFSPAAEVAWVHPATLVMLGGYIYGFHIVYESHQEPMWRPTITRDTRVDSPEEESEQGSLSSFWARFIVLAALVGSAGWVIAHTGISIARMTGLSETVVGGLFTAVSTSSPELVTAVAAVRHGALTLAVSNVIGGNAFDTLFIAAADVAYGPGSIYHAITGRELFLVALGIVLTGLLLMGLVRRETHGIVNIGFESFLIFVFYTAGFILLFIG